jgi:hypothetical protein
MSFFLVLAGWAELAWLAAPPGRMFVVEEGGGYRGSSAVCTYTWIGQGAITPLPVECQGEQEVSCREHQGLDLGSLSPESSLT